MSPARSGDGCEPAARVEERVLTVTPCRPMHPESPRPLDVAKAPLAYLAAHRKAFSTSFLNQAVSSGSSFLLGVFLVRALSPAEFGLYGLGIAVTLLYGGIGNALFVTQMVVHTPDRPDADRLPYAARMLGAIALFGAVTLLVAPLAGWIVGLLVPAVRERPALAPVVALASVSYVLKDYFVRQAYTARAEHRALAINCVGAASLAASLTLMHFADKAIGAEWALVLSGGSQVVGCGVGLYLARLPLRAARRAAVLDALAASWNGGRWAVGGTLVTWVQSQAYVYVTALFGGTAAVGGANAARLLVSPLLFMMPAVNQVTMPRLADTRAHNRARMLKTGRIVTSSLAVIAIAYSVLLIGVVDKVVPAILGPKYTGMRTLVIAWCIALVALVLRDGASVLLQVMKNFRALTVMNAVSALVSLLCVAALAHAYGASGAVFGTSVGEALLAALLWRVVRHERVGELG